MRLNGADEIGWYSWGMNDPTTEILATIVTRLERIERTLQLGTESPYMTAREAAAYLRISESTFRKKARLIRRQPGTGRYRKDDLDEFAATMRSKKRR